MQYLMVFVIIAISFSVILVVVEYMSGRQIIKQRYDLMTNYGEDNLRSSGIRAVIKHFSGYFETSSWANKQEVLLMQAGLPFRGSEFLVISIGTTLLGVALLLIIFKGNLLLALLGGIVGFYLPSLVVKRKIKKKQMMIEEQLPAALTLMANCLRTGYSYLQAIDVIAKEMTPPISEEFGFVLREMNLGISTEEAFNNLVRRINTADMDLTVTAFLIQRQVGGNLAELLDNISQTIRERVSMRGKIQTLTAQGKTSGIVLSLLPIVLGFGIYIIDSNYLVSFFSARIGQILLVMAIVSQILGILWIRKIIDIDT